MGQLIINEAASRNHTLRDADGDTPDWIELVATNGSVDLSDWSLTDDREEPRKWVFSEGRVGEGEFHFVWASGKDRASGPGYRTLVDPAAGYRYLASQVINDFDWRGLDYDDTSWRTGVGGVGYGSEDDETLLVEGTQSVFVRQAFTVSDPGQIQELLLQVEADDGFAAYLNGVLVAARYLNDGLFPAATAYATQPEPPRLPAGLPLLRYPLTNAQDLLQPGRNVLAVQVHRARLGTVVSGLSLRAYLSAKYTNGSREGQTPPLPLNLAPAASHTNFRLSSGGETVYLYNPEGQLIDLLELPALTGEVSYGRTYDGGQLTYFAEPTPGAANTGRRALGFLTDEVVFSRPPGPVDDGPFLLQLTHDGANGQIHYTLDGTSPGPDAPTYTTPLWVGETSIVRAAVHSLGYLPSPTASAAYLFDAQHDLPVVNLTFNPPDFFGQDHGIYVLGEGYRGGEPHYGSNIWDEREVPVHFGYYPPAGEAVGQTVGAKIFGGFSRGKTQRSLSLAARGRYGTAEFSYPFFPNRPYTTFKDLVLRNSGNDWLRTYLQDLTLTGLMEGSGLDVQAGRPVATYFNGEYWGLFNLREKINADFLATRHGLAKEDIDLIERNGVVRNGDDEAYRELMDFVAANDLSNQAHYNYVAARIDVDNFIRYNAVQVYWDNRDWPGNNMRLWRPRTPGGKWRWILYDTDLAAGWWGAETVETNTLAYVLDDDPQPGTWNELWATQLLRKLMKNRRFRNRFVNQLADEMNERFLPDKVAEAVEARAGRISSEIPAAFARYGANPATWPVELDRLKTFFVQRPPVVKAFVLEQFALPAHHPVTVELADTARGYVQLNSLTLTEAEWTGDYFENVPIQLKAVAKPGYEFFHWELDSDSYADSISVNITDVARFRPVFVPAPPSDATAVQGLERVNQLTVTPNPLRTQSLLRFGMNSTGRVIITLLDTYGREVRTVVDRNLAAGRHRFQLATGDLPIGVYFLRVTEGGSGQAVVRLVKH